VARIPRSPKWRNARRAHEAVRRKTSAETAHLDDDLTATAESTAWDRFWEWWFARLEPGDRTGRLLGRIAVVLVIVAVFWFLMTYPDATLPGV